MAHTGTTGDDDLVVRRSLVTARKALPAAVLVALLAASVSWLGSNGEAERFVSQGSLELTDDVASGINLRGTRGDALIEIDAQLLRLESREFRASVDAALGEDAKALQSITASNRQDTPVLVLEAIADGGDLAEFAVNVALDRFIASRVEATSLSLSAELATLETQRLEQLELIDSLAFELEAKRGVVAQDEISILESRTAAALRRLEAYDVAIQEREFLSAASTGQLRVVNRATDAAVVSNGSLKQALQMAVLIFVLGLVVAVLIGRFRGRLVLLDEVRSIAGPDIPVLATVPKFRSEHRKGQQAVVVGRRNTRREAEAFRYLRTAIEVATDGMTPVVIAFTSSGPNEGKTVTSVNYALATARAERSVALLDGDLLNPSTAALFDAQGSNGFVGLITGRIDPSTEQWHRVVTSGEPLDVLVSGRESTAPERQELPTHAVEATFGKLAQVWDTIVVDCPPVLAVSDAMVLARAADVAILMVRMGYTTKRDLDTALTQLEQNQVNIAGIVVTHSTEKNESYYGYGYGYGAEGG